MSTIISEETTQLAQLGGFTPPTQDPLRGYYGVISAVLILEALTVILSLAVIFVCVKEHHLIDSVFIGLVAVILVLLCAKVKRSWFWGANGILQFFLVLTWLIHPGIGACGIVFLGVWIYVYRVGAKMRTKIRQGQLRGQESLSPLAH